MLSNYDFPNILTKTFQQIGEAILIFDIKKSNELIIFANKSIYEITGNSPDYFIGKDINSIDLSVAKLPNKEKLLNTFHQKKKCTVDIIIHKNDNTNVYSRITVNPIRNTSNEIEYIVLIIRDITEARLKLLNCIKLEIVSATLESVNDIVFNYMNELQVFRMDCEETTHVSKDKLADFDDTFNDTLRKLKKINTLMEIKEKSLSNKISVLNHTNN